MTVQTLDDVGELAQQIDRALASVGSGGQPTVILARTRKGRGFSEVEDREGVVGQGVAAGGAGLERDGASGEGRGQWGVRRLRQNPPAVASSAGCIYTNPRLPASS